MDLKEKELIVKYINEFLVKDRYRAIYYCSEWNGYNGRFFNRKLPEDYIIEVLTKIYEGKKCYLKDYKTFKGSIYFYLKFEMLSYFKVGKGKNNTGKNSELSFTNAELSSLLKEELYYEGAESIYSNVETEELRENILALFDPNKEVEEIIVIEEMLKGGRKEDIAKDLGINIEYLNNIERRIKIKLHKRGDGNIL